MQSTVMQQRRADCACHRPCARRIRISRGSPAPHNARRTPFTCLAAVVHDDAAAERGQQALSGAAAAAAVPRSLPVVASAAAAAEASVPPSAAAAADEEVADAAGAARHRQEQRRAAQKERAATRPAAAAAAAPVVLQEGPAAVAGALPDVLAATWPATFPTLSAARRQIRKDLILVDGQLGSCKSQVSAGQLLQQVEPAPRHKAPRAVTLQVAFEDDHLAVIHKPWGVKMHGGDARRTITGALAAPGGGGLQPSSSPDALPQPKPVHRLDAAVGGLLVVAKTAPAAVALAQQFADRQVHKVYLALLSGRLVPGAGASAAAAGAGAAGAHAATSDDTSDDGSDEPSSEPDSDGDGALPPLPELLQRQLQGQAPFSGGAAYVGADSLLLLLQPPTGSGAAGDAGGVGAGGGAAACAAAAAGALDAVHVVDQRLYGKPCYSLYQVLGYSRCSRYGGWMTLAALSPVTGRKHQLRQHMAALGHPIIGDGRYTLEKSEHISNQGIFLESVEVWLTHPTTGEALRVQTREPARFATLRLQQANRWRKLTAAAQEIQEGERA